MPDYLSIAVFAAISILIPASTLLFSKLVRPASDENEVKTLNYESAEQSVGQRITVMSEYLHYFSIFLAVEIIGIILLIWSPFARAAGSASNYVVALPLFGMLLASLLLLIKRSRP